MDKERRQMWADYFAHLANRVGLRDWRVYVLDEAPDGHDNNDQVGADVDSVFGKKVCRVRLCDDWEDQPAEIQREYAVHELVHMHFEQPTLFANHRFHESYSEREFAAHDATYRYLMEFGVDSLAKVIAPALNLPGQVIQELSHENEEQVQEEFGVFKGKANLPERDALDAQQSEADQNTGSGAPVQPEATDTPPTKQIKAHRAKRTGDDENAS